MSFKKYFADKDTTISNAFKPSLTTRATGSNMGRADSTEIFKIYGQVTTSSSELSRALYQFPVSRIISDRASRTLPSSGSVSFYLRLYNAATPFTIPENVTYLVQPLSASWEEGRGLDLDTYRDDTRDGEGANWINRASGSTWTTPGGDYLSTPHFTQSMDTGLEDVEIDITPLVEEWVAGTISNNGLTIRLSGSLETDNKTYFTKRLFARSSEFFFKKPHIEARWDSTIKDSRGRFYTSSSLLTSDENIQTVYLYNYFKGQLRDIPSIGTGSIFVKVFQTLTGSLELSTSVGPNYPVTGGWVDTGIYTASFYLDSAASNFVYDLWFDSSLTTCFHTGTIKTEITKLQNENNPPDYVFSILNLKSLYSPQENPRIRLFTRKKNWQPTIFTIAKNQIDNYIVEDIYYKVVRLVDREDVVPYGTGTLNHTRLSYDYSGSYFDFDMSVLEPGYSYSFKFLVKQGNVYEQLKEEFRFRVDN